MNHNEPIYHRYKGGYDKVTKCDDCDRLGLYEDQHPLNPCIDCGGNVEEYKAMKWDTVSQKWYRRGESPPDARPPKGPIEKVDLKPSLNRNSTEEVVSNENFRARVFIICMVSFIVGFVLGKI